MPGYPDWSGVPLVQGFTALTATPAVLAVPANSSASVTMSVTKPGYGIDIFITGSAANANPFCQVQMTWQDSALSTILAVETFYLPVTSAGVYRVCGSGPARGQALTMKVTNYDAAHAVSVTYTVFGCTQYAARDDWRTVDYQTANVPGFGTVGNIPNGVAKGDMASLMLITETNDTIPAGVTWSFLLPLFAGPVVWQFLANANIAVSIRIPAALPAAAPLDATAPIWIDLTLTDVTVQLAHPRCPLVVFLQNSSGGPIAGVSVMAVAVENSS